MGKLDLLPFLGSHARKFIPIILIILCICNSFQILGRILAFCGLIKNKYNKDFKTERMEEGQKLLQLGKN